jgi:hypothetical protein
MDLAFIFTLWLDRRMKISSYKVNKKHRASTPSANASIWTVSEWVEVHLFAEAGNNEWKSPQQKTLWALRPGTKGPAKIGTDTGYSLYFAKFVCDLNDEWHGYPVHPRGDDVPPESVLEDWRERSYIDKTDKRRIQTGKFQ